MNRYNIFWAGVKNRKLYILIRPSGTTGTIAEDCKAKIFSFMWSAEGIYEVKIRGSIGTIGLDETRALIPDKNEKYTKLSIEGLKEFYPSFIEDFERAIIFSILAGNE